MSDHLNTWPFCENEVNEDSSSEDGLEDFERASPKPGQMAVLFFKELDEDFEQVEFEECTELVVMPEFNSYQELLNYYHKFLNREVESLHDVLEEESDAIVPQLLAINRAGILSFSSQPGSLFIETSGAQYRQRAYLSCYMKRELTKKLQEKCARDVCIIMLVEELDDLNDELSSFIDLSELSGGEESTICAEMAMGFKFLDLEHMLSGTSAEKHEVISKDLVQVHFIDLEWGNEANLFDSLVKWLAED